MSTEPDSLNNTEYFEQLIRRKTNALSQVWIKGLILGFLLFCLLMGMYGFWKVISTYSATEEKKSTIEQLIPSNNPSDEP